MTLYRQLVIVVVLVAALMLFGTLWLSVDSTRDYLRTQLASHAQDTATSLGLSLSPAIARGDIATMNAMVDAIFDRGYYRSLEVVTTKGEALVTRSLPVRVEGVPAWFIEWLPLDVPDAQALVMAGWQQAGRVHVVSHPGYGYEQLWQTTRRLALFYGLGALCVALLGILGLRVLLRPLHTVEAQAQAVVRREFPIAHKLPRTRELRNVVMAMNRMIAKIQAIFEEQALAASRLQDAAFRDSVTGLGNRVYFDTQFANRLIAGTDSPGGALLLVRLQELERLNIEQGYAAGDTALASLGTEIMEAVFRFEHPLVARLRGADIAIYLVGAHREDVSEIATTLTHADKRQMTGAISVGAALYDGRQGGEELLATADAALREATSHGDNAWVCHPAQDTGALAGRQAWKSEVVAQIEQGGLALFLQKVARITGEETLHSEVLVRLPSPGGGLIPASLVFPVAQESRLGQQLDRQIVSMVLGALAAADHLPALSVNLCRESVAHRPFREWLEHTLSQHEEIAPRLNFEVSESIAMGYIDDVIDLVRIVRVAGAGFGLDHFGRGFGDFAYLQTLHPDYVKLDAAYLCDLASNDYHQFFIRSLTSVAHSLDILVVAEAVEHDEAKTVLAGLNIDAVQGHAVARPHRLDVPA